MFKITVGKKYNCLLHLAGQNGIEFTAIHVA